MCIEAYKLIPFICNCLNCTMSELCVDKTLNDFHIIDRMEHGMEHGYVDRCSCYSGFTIVFETETRYYTISGLCDIRRSVYEKAVWVEIDGEPFVFYRGRC